MLRGMKLKKLHRWVVTDTDQFIWWPHLVSSFLPIGYLTYHEIDPQRCKMHYEHKMHNALTLHFLHNHFPSLILLRIETYQYLAELNHGSVVFVATLTPIYRIGVDVFNPSWMIWKGKERKGEERKERRGELIIFTCSPWAELQRTQINMVDSKAY